MTYKRPCRAFAWCAALFLVSPSAAIAQDHDGKLIAAAFEKAKAATPQIEVESLSCSPDQYRMIEFHGSELSYPCVVRHLVETIKDAEMAVTLLLAQARPVDPDFAAAVPPFEQSVAAIGVALAGSQLDPDVEAKHVIQFASENEGIMSPSLASFLPRESDTFRAEVARIEREKDAQRMARKHDDKHDAKDRKAREEYQSVTDFLAFSTAQQFCPADGRAFLARAAELASSSEQAHRTVGLWADGRRHALAPYLNDVSRCS